MDNFKPIGVELTNEKIKSLPTTPLEIVPAKEGQQIVVCLDEEQKEIGFIYITQYL